MIRQLVDVSDVTALVTDAAAAPSLHNAQPWKFRFLRERGVLRLYADLERALPRTDPDNRNLHLGCGAALLNLRVAAAASGRGPSVRLLPDRADPALLAELDLHAHTPADAALAELHPAISRRHSSRHPFRDEQLPDGLTDRLCEAARGEGAELVFPGPWHVASILELVEDAEGREAVDLGVRDEMAHWAHATSTDAPGTSDGIPAEAFGPRQHGGAGFPVRDFAAGRKMPGRSWAAFEKNPHIALLGTVYDRPEDWLRAGQALERVLLRATADGLVASVTSQPLEWPELRWAARDPVSDMAYVQMVIRVGHGPEGRPSPRRPVADLLDVE
ncbi:nitroreductase [Streptomyces pluripotens]|uniref:Nitroreductase n=1 Tax=Streptomyces pluripotens TaxID=1355015 RepID=A0A221NSB8_9ACTN|nr:MULTISPECIES: nitroreductase [Streptomyces]ARP68633.1 nitroreductase [Streptomyces pluripotens]ASN22893.1 nitroreductase [Streptomyces pluripotens]KIE26730.1 nitroreductase [Streptomyces sp. MUSC 125]MCH0559277.1 nitroreductase [Streptomyces sp. MUM 16J]